MNQSDPEAPSPKSKHEITSELAAHLHRIVHEAIADTEAQPYDNERAKEMADEMLEDTSTEVDHDN